MTRPAASMALLAALASVATLAGCGDARRESVQYPPLALEQELRVVNPTGAGEQAQIGGGTVDRDGSIYLTEWTLSAVQVLDSSGRLLRRIGEPGREAGQLLLPGTFGLLGDTLWVADPPLGRITRFTREGRLLGVIEDPESESVAAAQTRKLAGLLPGGARLYSLPPRPIESVTEGGRVQPEQIVQFVRITDEGRTDSLFRLRIPGTYTLPYSREARPRPFDHTPLLAVRSDGGAWIEVERRSGESDSVAVVTRFSADRGREWSVPLRVDTERIPKSVADSIASAWTFESESREALRAWLRVPARVPFAFAASLSDDDTIWIQEGTRADTARWIRLDATGTPTGQVRLPREVQVLRTSAERLWVVERDSRGVPALVRYRVR